MAVNTVLRLCQNSARRAACYASTGFRHQSSNSTASSPSGNQDDSSYTLRKDPADADNLMDIGTRKIFNEEHDIYRASVRKFFQEEVAPNILRYEEQGQVDRELWEKAGAQGILGASTPEEHGGIGADLYYSAITWEEQGYINDSGCGFPLHSDIVMPYISNYGSPEQIAKFIPEMTAGKMIGAIAMSEPAAGSDLQGIKTHAKRDGDDWILNGSKVFITNGWMCDVCIVVAITDPDARSAAHGISLFLVEADMPGFVKGRKLNKMGQKAQDTAELFFDDVRLPTSSILGGEAGINHGFYQLMQELPLERLLIGAAGLATSEWMFEETRAYVRQRKAFRRTIADLQTVQHKLAEMKTSLCVARAFVDDCIVAQANHRLSPDLASMAKYWCTDLQNKVAYDCVQLHGGWGYMWEYSISRAYINARPQSIYGGSNEIMKELIARKIVKG